MANAIDPGTSGTALGAEEERRRAILRRLAQVDQNDGPQISEGGPGDFLSARPTVAAQVAGTPRDAHDRMSVLERNEQAQAGAFAGSGASLSSSQQDYIRQEIERTARMNAAQNRTERVDRGQDNANLGGTPGQYKTLTEQGATPEQVLDIRRASERPGSIVSTSAPLSTALKQTATQQQLDNPLTYLGAIGPAQQFGGVTDLASAIARRLGIAAKPAATAIGRAGPAAADDLGRGFRLVGEAKPSLYRATGEGLDILGDTGPQVAARARSTAAGLREAAGVTDDAAAAAARAAAAPPTPLTEAILKRLGRVPTPVKVGIGAGLGGATAVPFLPPAPQATGPEQVQEQPSQYEATQPRPVAPQPVQPGQATPPTSLPRGRVSTPPAAATPPAAGPVTGTPIDSAPVEPRVGRPFQEPPFVPGKLGPVPGSVDPSRPTPGPADVGAPPGRRVGGPPPGVTPGQTPAGPTLGPVPQGPVNSEAMRTQVIADLNGLVQQINAGPQAPDVMALFLSQGSSLLKMIDEQEKALRAQSEQEGRTIDPATQNTLDTLREQLGVQLKATKERLNARGLLDSGILVEAEQMLTKGNLSDQAKILAERLSRIQNSLSQGLAQFRSQRISTASTFGMAGAQAQTQAELAERNRLDQLRALVLQGRTAIAGQLSQEEQAAIQRDLQWELERLEREAADARQQADIAARRADAEAQRAWSSYEAELQRQFEETQQALRITAGQYAGGTPSSASQGYDTGATNEAVRRLEAAAASGITRDEAERELAQVASKLALQGVDLAKLRGALSRIYGGS